MSSILLLGVDPSWENYPGADNIWISPEGRAFKRVNINHPERRQIKEYTPDIDKDGYLRLRLCGKKWMVHRLVYSLYVGPLVDGLVVCHLDNDQTNNHWSNLLQASQLENISHKAVHGTEQKGEFHPHAIHTNEQVFAVKRAISEAARTKSGRLGYGQAEAISSKLGVTKQLVYDLSRKRGENAWAA